FAAGFLVERIEVERALTLVAQQLNERRSTFFLCRLELALAYPNQVHLQGFRENRLGIPAIGTRQGQINDSVFGPLSIRSARVYPKRDGRTPHFDGFFTTRRNAAAPADTTVGRSPSVPAAS